MKPNPYEPVSLPLDERSIWTRLVEFARRPAPIRVAREHPFRWIVDAIVGFTLCIGGFLVAGLVREPLRFLGPMAYPTALPIGLFPVGVWIHYCGAGRGTTRSNALLILGLMSSYAVQAGMNGVAMLPISLGVLAVTLPVVWNITKLVLGLLPGSSYRQRKTEQPDARETSASSVLKSESTARSP